MQVLGPELSAALLWLTRLNHRRRLIWARRAVPPLSGVTGRGDAGVTTEYVLLTALVIGLSLGVLGIIIAKVTAKAQSLDLG